MTAPVVVTGQVLGDGLGQDGQGHALEPDVAWARENDQVVTVGPEQVVADALHTDHRELHGVFEEADVPGVNEHRLSLDERVVENLT